MNETQYTPFTIQALSALPIFAPPKYIASVRRKPLSRAVFAAAALLAGAQFSSIAARAARPAAASATHLSGTWGWISGSQTYLRARPSAQTPPVAKIAAHSKLFVWGKYDGWYRVETTDHVFGWVYNTYLHVPASSVVRELSHAKAKLASDRTGHQALYGSVELLQKYYAHYGAAGAASSLRREGIKVAARPAAEAKPAPAVARSGAVISSPRLVSTGARAVRVSARAMATAASGGGGAFSRGIARSATLNKPGYAHSTVAYFGDPSFNDVGNVRLGPVQQTSGNRWERTESQSLRPEQDIVPDPGAIAPAAAQPTLRLATAPYNTRTSPTSKSSHAKAKSAMPVAARHTVAAATAAATARSKAKARAVSTNPYAGLTPQQAAARRAAQTKLWVQAQLAKRWAAKRDSLRRSMGTPIAAVPPGQTTPVAPLSPQELLKARSDFLASATRRSSAPAPLNPTAGNRVAKAQQANFKPGQALAARGAFKVMAANTAKGKTSAGAIHSRGGSPRDYAAAARHGNSFGDSMAQQAYSYRGMPYIFGASSPNRGFDCSGLIFYLLRQRGYKPPRTASELASFGTRVEPGHLKAGDIVLFANTYKHGVSHVGVYMGNGKFVHAANPGKGVRVDSLFNGYYAKKYYGARRVK